MIRKKTKTYLAGLTLIVVSAANLTGSTLKRKVGTAAILGQSTGFKGPYLGQAPPGKVPQVFAPGIVSMPTTREFGAAFSADGREFYFTRATKPQIIMMTREEADGWTVPAPAAFSAGFDAGHRLVALRPAFMAAQEVDAGVGGDPHEPVPQRHERLVTGQAAPGAQQGLLGGVLGVVIRAEHPVAVQVDRA